MLSKKQHKDFLEDNLLNISSATEMIVIWCKLGTYWNFLNYSLLEYLVKEFCSEDDGLIAMMEDYKSKLKEFRCCTRLCNFVNHFMDVTCLEEANFKKFEVKLNKKFEECTLEDLENWKENITQKLLLPSFVMKLHTIGPGCVSVTWAIPTKCALSLMENMKKMDLREFFEEHCIISVKLDGESLDYKRSGQ